MVVLICSTRLSMGGQRLCESQQGIQVIFSFLCVNGKGACDCRKIFRGNGLVENAMIIAKRSSINY